MQRSIYRVVASAVLSFYLSGCLGQAPVVPKGAGVEAIPVSQPAGSGGGSAGPSGSSSGSLLGPETPAVALPGTGGGGNPGTGKNFPVSITSNIVSDSAPAHVLFTSTGTDSPKVTEDFLDLDYRWYVKPRGQSSAVQAGSGPVMGYTFDKPGIYDVTLNADDYSGAQGSKTVVVTILDANAKFSGQKTVALSTDGKFVGAPQGAKLVTVNGDLDKAIQPLLDKQNGHLRILLKRGQKYQMSKGVTVKSGSSAQLDIGAYGTGSSPDSRGIHANNPIVDAKGSSRYALFFLSRASHFKLHDLHFLDSPQVKTIIDTYGQIRNFMFHHNRVIGFYNPIPVNWNRVKSLKAPMHTHVAITYSHFDNFTGWGGYIASRFLAIVGCFWGASINSHTLRIGFADKADISKNVIYGSKNNQLQGLKGHNAPGNDPTYHALYGYTQDISFMENHLISDISKWVAAWAPQDSINKEYIRRVRWERNRMEMGVKTSNALYLSVKGARVRWNLFIYKSNLERSNTNTVNFRQRGIEPKPENLVFAHNTIVSLTQKGSTIDMVEIGTTNGGIVVANNLGYSVKRTINTTTGGSATVFNNFIGDPKFTNLMGGDYSLQKGSLAIGFGKKGLFSRLDFLYRLIAPARAPDAGAIQRP